MAQRHLEEAQAHQDEAVRAYGQAALAAISHMRAAAGMTEDEMGLTMTAMTSVAAVVGSVERRAEAAEAAAEGRREIMRLAAAETEGRGMRMVEQVERRAQELREVREEAERREQGGREEEERRRGVRGAGAAWRGRGRGVTRGNGQERQ